LPQRALELKRDRREILRERVVDVAGEPRPLLGARQPLRALAQVRPIDRHAEVRAERREQVQVAFAERAPVRSAQVHDAELPRTDAQRHAGVIFHAARHVRFAFAPGFTQAAALDHVDVLRDEIAVQKRFETPAIAAGHLNRLLQDTAALPRRCEVKALALLVEQPDPARGQIEETGDDLERPLECRAHVRDLAERGRHRFEEQGVTRSSVS
jgi:hypothetical protein